jgi:hypothetical protein
VDRIVGNKPVEKGSAKIVSCAAESLLPGRRDKGHAQVFKPPLDHRRLIVEWLTYMIALLIDLVAGEPAESEGQIREMGLDLSNKIPDTLSNIRTAVGVSEPIDQPPWPRRAPKTVN